MLHISAIAESECPAARLRRIVNQLLAVNYVAAAALLPVLPAACTACLPLLLALHVGSDRRFPAVHCA